MYQIWIWSHNAEQYVPERDLYGSGKRIEFEHWTEAQDYLSEHADDGHLRHIEYRSTQGRKRRRR